MQGAQAAERGALFKVSGGGHTMHLFGTMHVGLAEFYPLEPRIRAAVAAAPILALEIDPLADPASMLTAIRTHAMLAPDAKGYQDQAPAARKRIEKALVQAGIDPVAVARFKPWLVATTLALAEYAGMGYRADQSVDMHLAQMARAANVKVIALETVEGQLGMFDSLNTDEQWRFLDESIGLIESGRQKKEVRDIVEAWSRADKAGLDAIALRAENDMSVSGRFIQNVMLDQRNVPLADKLAALLARENHAVAAVGVLHLLGAKSIPALLRAKGLTVERIY